jgi:predicted phosphodiesterase
MRWLILGDIHANREALEAVVDAARGLYDSAVCLGDLVGYGPDPNAVVEWVRENVGTCVRGNHDKATWDLQVATEFQYAARIAAEWTQTQLSEENLRYLRGLPQGPLHIGSFQIVHGSPRDEDKYLVSQGDVFQALQDLRPELVFFGHTHSQGGYFEDEGGHLQEVKPALFRGCSLVALELLPGEKYLLNPGSVGQPRDGDVRAAWALYDDRRRQVEYWRVPYPFESTQQRMEEVGLPDSLVQRLSFGH